MFMRPRPILLFFVAMTISAAGTPPDTANVTSEEGSSKNPAPSAASRLGIKFSPPVKNGDSPVFAPQLPEVSPSDSTLPVTVLTPYHVTTPRALPTEKEMQTEKATLEIAKKTQLTPLYRYTFGPLSQLGTYYANWLSILGGWHPNDLEAMVLYRQEEDLRRKVELDSLTRLEKLYDAKDAELLHLTPLQAPPAKPGLFILSPR